MENIQHITISRSYSVYQWIWRVWCNGIVVGEFVERSDAEKFVEKLKNQDNGK